MRYTGYAIAAFALLAAGTATAQQRDDCSLEEPWTTPARAPNDPHGSDGCEIIVEPPGGGGSIEARGQNARDAASRLPWADVPLDTSFGQPSMYRFEFDASQVGLTQAKDAGDDRDQYLGYIAEIELMGGSSHDPKHLVLLRTGLADAIWGGAIYAESVTAPDGWTSIVVDGNVKFDVFGKVIVPIAQAGPVDSDSLMSASIWLAADDTRTTRLGIRVTGAASSDSDAHTLVPLPPGSWAISRIRVGFLDTKYATGSDQQLRFVVPDPDPNP